VGDIADRYVKVAAQFTARAVSVPAAAWDNPAPCDGWVARDVVHHLVEWMPGFLSEHWDVAFPPVAVDTDPVGAWTTVSDTIGAALDDATLVQSERDTQAGRKSFEGAVSMLCIPDILVHTWDLARATGLDETLDADEVHAYLADVEQMGDAMDRQMRESGHFGPRVDVPADADEQTRLLAFLGRRV
jgi:uncharacterized protein (TIGR03086 family)